MSQLVRRPHTIYSTFPWRGYPYLPPIRAAREREPRPARHWAGLPSARVSAFACPPSVPGTPLVGHGLPLDAGEEFPAVKMHMAVNLDHIPPWQRCTRPGT
jgi:hypothetical protein